MKRSIFAMLLVSTSCAEVQAPTDGGGRTVTAFVGVNVVPMDRVPGFSIHREMQLYVDAGMTPYQVISSGTRVVGDYFGENFGTIAVGQSADLILVDGNPWKTSRTSPGSLASWRGVGTSPRKRFRRGWKPSPRNLDCPET